MKTTAAHNTERLCIVMHSRRHNIIGFSNSVAFGQHFLLALTHNTAAVITFISSTVHRTGRS